MPAAMMIATALLKPSLPFELGVGELYAPLPIEDFYRWYRG
jgi:hypothetical protein